MTRFNISAAFIASLSLMVASCSNQRYVSGETDDIYYSSGDRYMENNNEFSQVEEVRGEDYKSNESTSSDEYFSIGKEQRKDDVNPNAASAYTPANQFDTNYTSSGGGTVNNFYGTTNYYEGDYYDDSYATRIRRFNSTNVGLSYSYYDPYFVSPYWSYGWSYWDPYPLYPYSGWSIGWSSWSGWNIGYSWGWGWGYPYGSWYRPYYSYCNPWAWNYWGYPGYYGYGYGSYWHGYRDGYWDGYYTGIWNDGNGIGRSRGTYIGRRDQVINGGFAQNVRGTNPNNTASNTSSGRVATPAGATGRTTAVSDGRVAGTIGDGREVARPASAQYSANSRDNLSASAEKFSSNSSLYQVRTNDGHTRTSDVNTRAQGSAAKYAAARPAAQAQSTPAASNKYNPGTLSRSEQVRNQYPAARPAGTPQGNTNPGSRVNTPVQQPTQAVDRASGTRTYTGPTSGTVRSTGDGRYNVQTQPVKPQGSANIRSYQPESQQPQRTRDYSVPRDNGTSTNRYYQQPARSSSYDRENSGTSRSYTNPGTSSGRTYSDPGRQYQPSNTTRPSATPRVSEPVRHNSGSSRMSAPARSNPAPRVNSSPSRSFSAPSGGGSRNMGGGSSSPRVPAGGGSSSHGGRR